MKINLHKFVKVIKRNWFSILLLIALLFSLASCGSIQNNKQKKDIEQQKTEVVDKSETSENETKTETENEIKTDLNSVTEELEEEVVIRPINPDKPMVVDGKEYHNTEINKRKSSKKTEASEQKTEIEKTTINELSKNDKSEKTTSKEAYTESSTEKSKQSKSSIWVDLWWLWLLIFIILVLKVKQRTSLF